MGLRSILPLLCVCSAAVALNDTACTNKQSLQKSYSVPGDTALLKSSLCTGDVTCNNISWYYPRTGRELGDADGQLVVRGESLWLLNVQPKDAGEYVTIVRTPSTCLKQTTTLVVEESASGSCQRPWPARQVITYGGNDHLSCPLKDYIKELKNYNLTYTITWRKGCTPIVDGSGRFTYPKGRDVALVQNVQPQDHGNYTCTLNFTLRGAAASVSTTIAAKVKENYYRVPEVQNPGNVIVKAEIGGSLIKTCLVFVPCVGPHQTNIRWKAHGKYIYGNGRVFSKPPTKATHQELTQKGVWLEKELHFTKLLEEDFYVNYTCYADNAQGRTHGYFTLIPADPNILLPIRLVFCGVALVFIASGVFYYLFKIDIVLWFRKAFHILYTNTDSDGKLYDAYVAYPRRPGPGAGREVEEVVEEFTFNMLPQVLERKCGYRLFIAARDGLPGQATADCVEEGIRESRTLLLLYTASTFTSGARNNNNNIIPEGCSTSRRERSSKGNCEANDISMLHVCHCSIRYNDDIVSGMHVSSLSSSDLYKVSSGISSDDPTSRHNAGTPNSCCDIVGTKVSRDVTSCTHYASTPSSCDVVGTTVSSDVTSSSANPPGDCDTRCEEGDFGAEQAFEREAAMYRALVEGSLKVVLVELEQLNPQQLALLPESVRHLRQKQGAVCWWKTRAGRGTGGLWRRPCLGGRAQAGGSEGPAQAPLSPSSRFWKELRYHMPLRCKRTADREHNALLGS